MGARTGKEEGTVTKSAIVQSVFDFALREINALEIRIVTAEDDADTMLWEQARQVVAQLEAGLSQVALAKQWLNPRNNNQPYSRRHVQVVREVVECYLNSSSRPRFRDAYNEITNAEPKGAHVGHNSGENEWYTPAEYLDPARRVLGAIDLDPASCETANTLVGAAQFYSLRDDGLEQPWRGRVWLNPPYAQPLVSQFCEKLAWHVREGDVPAAVALVNNATETQWFGTLVGVATAVCFPSGRVRFWAPDKSEAAPLQGQALVYIGPAVERFAQEFAEVGWVARL